MANNRSQGSDVHDLVRRHSSGLLERVSTRPKTNWEVRLSLFRSEYPHVVLNALLGSKAAPHQGTLVGGQTRIFRIDFLQVPQEHPTVLVEFCLCM